MDAAVELESGMRFIGRADTGFEVAMDSTVSVGGADSGFHGGVSGKDDARDFRIDSPNGLQGAQAVQSRHFIIRNDSGDAIQIGFDKGDAFLPGIDGIGCIGFTFKRFYQRSANTFFIINEQQAFHFEFNAP